MPGFEGINCEIDVDECEQHRDRTNDEPCDNGGVCVDQIDGYKCVCPRGYNGERCERSADDCRYSDRRCENGGTCRQVKERFSLILSNAHFVPVR